jgi:hypothetical protein
VQLNVKVAVLLSAPVDSVPEVGFEPLHPPEAVHEVASVDDHDSIVEPSTTTEVAAASRVTVGIGGGEPLTVTVALRIGLVPPAPVHCIE